LAISTSSPGGAHKRYLMIEPDFQAKRKEKACGFFID
jgi:hypothetical protein